MSALHLVRLVFNPEALSLFALDEGVNDDDHGYAMHLALRRRFGASAPQPFRVFASGKTGPHLLGYTTDPAALIDASGLPSINDTLDKVFPSAPNIRAMPENWRSGARFAFDVRVRPVVRFGPKARALRRAEGKPAPSERDAFLAALEKPNTDTPSREAVYRDWFARQMADAAVVEHVDITQMRRLTTHRSNHGKAGGRCRVEGYEVFLKGHLAIDNPSSFSRLLQLGVGRHAAFGFGMLALAPANSS